MHLTIGTSTHCVPIFTLAWENDFFKKKFLFSCHVPSSSDAESSRSSVSSASVGKRDRDFNQKKPATN